MHISNIKSKEDVVRYVNEVGYLPFFRNHIAGFSLEDIAEHCWGDELCRGAYHRTSEESLE